METNNDFDEGEKSDSSPKFSLQTGLFLSAVVVAIAGTLICSFRFDKKGEVSEFYTE